MCFISALFTKMKPKPEKWQLGDFSRVISCKKRKHSFLAIKLEDVLKKKTNKQLMGVAKVQESGQLMHMGSDLIEYTFE